LPDWTSPERLEYTNRLFDLLAQLLPEGWPEASAPCRVRSGIYHVRRGSLTPFAEISTHVSNIFQRRPRARGASCAWGWSRSRFACWKPRAKRWISWTACARNIPATGAWRSFLGVNYDTCHLAVEFEEPAEALALLQKHRVKVCKIHLSNALKLRIADCGLRIADCGLKAFADDTYLHQVVLRSAAGQLTRYRDLDALLNPQSAIRNPQSANVDSARRDACHGRAGRPRSPIRNPQFANVDSARRDACHGGRDARAPQSAIRNPQSAIGNPQSRNGRRRAFISTFPLHTPPAEGSTRRRDHLLGCWDALQASPKLCSHLEMETYTWEVLPPELEEPERGGPVGGGI